MSLKTDEKLTKSFSGATVSYITKDHGMIWIVFQDGRVLSICTDDPDFSNVWAEAYQSQDIATIDNYGTSQEREAAGLC